MKRPKPVKDDLSELLDSFMRDYTPPVSITTGTTGAISELIACAHLMGRGYHVFRCESPNAPFDLVAYQAQVCLRVEVKSVTMHTPYAPSFCWPVNSEWDLLMVVGSPSHIFEFAPDVTREAASNVVRLAYGFGPLRRPTDRLGPEGPTRRPGAVAGK